MISNATSVNNMNRATRGDSVKNNFFVLGLLVTVCLTSSGAYGMEYNHVRDQEAREWILLANQISAGESADTAQQQPEIKDDPASQNQLNRENQTLPEKNLRDTLNEANRTVYDALSKENQRALDNYSPAAVHQALGELATNKDFQNLVAARMSRPALAQAGEEGDMQALEDAVELKLLSLLAHKQKLVTQEKDKEHIKAYKLAGYGGCSMCVGVCVGLVAFITWCVRTPECPLRY